MTTKEEAIKERLQKAINNSELEEDGIITHDKLAKYISKEIIIVKKEIEDLMKKTSCCADCMVDSIYNYLSKPDE